MSFWSDSHPVTQPMRHRLWSAAVIGDPSRTALVAALLLAAMTVPSTIALFVDDRTIQGSSVWSKPLKFQLSFALHWLAIACLLSCMEASGRTSAGLRRWVLAGVIAAIVEVGYITLQGARGRASHFNFETGAALIVVAATAAEAVSGVPLDRR